MQLIYIKECIYESFPFYNKYTLKNGKRNGHAEKKWTFLKCPFFNTWHYKFVKKVGSLEDAANPKKMIFMGLHNFFIFLEKDMHILSLFFIQNPQKVSEKK